MSERNPCNDWAVRARMVGSRRRLFVVRDSPCVAPQQANSEAREVVEEPIVAPPVADRRAEALDLIRRAAPPLQAGGSAAGGADFEAARELAQQLVRDELTATVTNGGGLSGSTGSAGTVGLQATRQTTPLDFSDEVAEAWGRFVELAAADSRHALRAVVNPARAMKDAGIEMSARGWKQLRRTVLSGTAQERRLYESMGGGGSPKSRY